MLHRKWPHLVAIVSAITALWSFEYFEKWGAEWFGIPVLLYCAVVIPITWYGLRLLQWFRSPWDEATKAHVLIPSLGMILCIAAGVYFTEPSEDTTAWQQGSATAGATNVASSGYRTSRAGRWYYSHQYYFEDDEPNVGSSNSSSGSSSSSDEGGEGLAILLLVILVIAAIIASAVVPHFWMVACTFCITALVMIALREDRVNARSRSPGFRRYRL